MSQQKIQIGRDSYCCALEWQRYFGLLGPKVNSGQNIIVVICNRQPELQLNFLKYHRSIQIDERALYDSHCSKCLQRVRHSNSKVAELNSSIEAYAISVLKVILIYTDCYNFIIRLLNKPTRIIIYTWDCLIFFNYKSHEEDSPSSDMKIMEIILKL